MLSLCDYGNYSKIPLIWLNKDKNRPKKGLFTRISGIKECPKWEKNNYEIYLLQLEANKFVLDSTTVITSSCSRTNLIDKNRANLIFLGLFFDLLESSHLALYSSP